MFSAVGERNDACGRGKPGTITENIGASPANPQDPRYRGHLVRIFKKKALDEKL